MEVPIGRQKLVQVPYPPFLGVLPRVTSEIPEISHYPGFLVYPRHVSHSLPVLSVLPPTCPSCHPLYPRSLARPLFETHTKSDLEASWAVGAAKVPGGAVSGPLHPLTSLVALRQLYGGQIEAVSLLAGLFLHLSTPALIFSTLAFPPPLAPWQASSSSPSSVSLARQRATGLPGD